MERRFDFAVALAVVLLAATPAWAQMGGVLNVNVPLSGVFTPHLPADQTGKPFIDYQFVVSAPGTYQIDLVSTDTSAYDPYIVLLQNGVRVASNDDGGSGLNSRLTRTLAPGYYVVRCTRFGSGPIIRPVAFTLSVTAAMTAPPPPPPPPVYAPLADSMARAMAIRFYNTRSEWRGQYAITLTRTRIAMTGPKRIGGIKSFCKLRIM